MKEHVTSLETSKKLIEGGVCENSKFVWSYSTPNDRAIKEWFVTQRGFHITDEIVSAYDLSELLEMVEELESLYPHNGMWCVGLYVSIDTVFCGDTPIEAVAEAVLWQKENQQ